MQTGCGTSKPARACASGRPDRAPRPPSLQPPISVQHVGRVFEDGSAALAGASFQLPAGDIAVLVGPSGCGKTTLLRMIGGIDAPTTGSISFGSVAARPRTAFAFQEPRLLPWRNVAAKIGRAHV